MTDSIKRRVRAHAKRYRRSRKTIRRQFERALDAFEIALGEARARIRAEESRAA